SEMTDISGHAVRSMYLYCGMSDYAALRHDEGYLAALNRLWEDVAERNMYITGGIGQSASNEGFTTDYSLPNKEAYCETCASVGMVLWNSRMNQFTGDSKFTDVLERAMYNGALAGISLKGDRFFYVNPLESDGNHHRQAWYGCACCPSQICRFLPSVGGYVYGLSGDAIWVHLYIGSEARIPVGRKEVRLRQETRYPWDGAVRLCLDDAWKGALRLRVPGWCKHWSVSVNGEQVSVPVEKGYAVLGGRSCGKDGVLRGGWKAGDEIVIDMDMPVEVVAADPRVKEDEGKRAIQRGPVVYCLEAVDQEEGVSLDGTLLNAATTYAHAFDAALLGGVEKIDAVVPGHPTLHYIPYYAWDNREAGPMKVWVDWVE
ncbi:MAG: glycoside hydrolase family 127 protein, partial [Bacteroidales bacterium]|nr:glycoside hydrolase family 127 protein [Bacteroidales bacterium]